jgi:hypothetical protein
MGEGFPVLSGAGAYPLRFPETIGGSTLPGMSLLELAEDSITFARSCTPLKSDNKGYGALSPVPPSKGVAYSPAKRLARSQAVFEVKKAMPPRDCNLTDILAYGHHVAKAHAGNCFEQCAAAMIHITWKLKGADTPFNIVTLASPGDHAFIALGQPLASRIYPKDFANWDAGAVICDPWAKIACKAAEYPAKWKAKMAKWDARELSIGRAKPATWSDAIEDSDKMSYMP